MKAALSTATKLDITTDSYTLTTNGLDTATITVVTRDSNNAAVGNVVVNLSTTAGFLSSSQVTTDTSGTATTTFSSGPEKTNQVASITATSGGLTKTLPITLSGTTLTLTSTKTSLLAGAGDNTSLTVKALDANSNPIPNADITLSSSLGNNITSGTTTASSITVTTNSSGTATATLTALNTPGTDIITASGLGTQKTLSVNVTNAQFGFTSPAQNSTLSVGTSTNLEVTWTDAAGAPVVGQTLTFSATNGTFGGSASTSAVTDASGKATVAYTASATATYADITVNSASESDSLHLLIVSPNPAQLNLQAAPSVLGVSVGNVSYSSTITATVRDTNNQLVSGQTVVFNLQAGPGGGEGISPGTAVTDESGTASVTFTSGSAVSAQNGVVISASLLSDPLITATTTLTINQAAASVILGTTNKIAKVTVNGLEVGYALPFSVLVVDTNGNPIPNATVNLGVYPIYFYTGAYPDRSEKFKNEDTNRNGVLDAGEDGARGWSDPSALPTSAIDRVWINGSENAVADIIDITSFTPGDTANGRLDPGGVVTIPDSVITDADGLAAFEIKYAKSFGNWIDVEITATTQVSGDLSTAKITVPLAVMENDTPYPDSPFGY